MRSFAGPSIASESRLLRSVWASLPDGPITEQELYRRLRAVPRVTTGNLADLVSRLVSAGVVTRVPGNNFQRGSLPPEPEESRRAVERRCSASAA